MCETARALQIFTQTKVTGRPVLRAFLKPVAERVVQLVFTSNQFDAHALLAPATLGAFTCLERLKLPGVEARYYHWGSGGGPYKMPNLKTLVTSSYNVQTVRTMPHAASCCAGIWHVPAAARSRSAQPSICKDLHVGPSTLPTSPTSCPSLGAGGSSKAQ